MTSYILTLVVFGIVDIVAILGFSLQFGVGGVVNFAFVLWQAAGAYTAAVLSLPSDNANGGFQHYIGGLNLPFPLPWIGAMLIGGILGLAVSPLMTRRLRSDNAAIALLVIALVVSTLVTNYTPFLNGDAGLALVPTPFAWMDSTSDLYLFVFIAVGLLVCVAAFICVRRITESPFGRRLRSVRDNDVVAEALGANVQTLRTYTLVIGGALGALSGAMLVGFIGVWSPAAWSVDETIILFASLIVGGLGNHFGAIVGVVLVQVALIQGSTYIPDFGRPGLVPALAWVLVGVLLLAFLYFRPNGIIPERRRHIKPALPKVSRDETAVTL